MTQGAVKAGRRGNVRVAAGSIAAWAIAAAPGWSAAEVAGAARPASVCTAAETPLFACTAARGRHIALCATGDAAVQYRYGRPGRVELAFPPDPADGPQRLLLSVYSRPGGVERWSIRFDNGGTGYTVFDWADESGAREAGVTVVAKADGSEKTLPCVRRARLDRQRLRAMLACDADSALGGCK